jgi:HD-GYP domain-containing protein (c-di-GMP phosphodiesterase class II)
MLTHPELAPLASAAAAVGDLISISGNLKLLLEQSYGMQFTIFDGATGKQLDTTPGQPLRDWSSHAEILREVARRGRPEFIDDEDPFLALALPLMDAEGHETVAVATILMRPLTANEDLSRQASRMGIQPEKARRWARSQKPWTPELLNRINTIVLDDTQVRDRLLLLQREVDNLSVNIFASSYEKIGLLCRMMQELNISKGVAIQLLPTSSKKRAADQADGCASVLLSRGDCPIDAAEFSELIAYLGLKKRHEPIVVNRSITERPDWPYPQVHQMIAVALSKSKKMFGWLAALNHVDDGEFGAVEAGLLASLATIVDSYSGNIELYRQQAELLEGIVGNLTSAIDVKDPYTRDHSNRVARVAVRLAEELGCDARVIDTLRIAGELHDIGKISIDYKVLCKPGKLSEEEYEHVKQHVGVGHHVLHDLARLKEVLPIVLYHHESWDGSGYPHNLESEQIPLAARIMAVADAFDAMSSDRPYRKRMPDAEVDRILRAGAGKQWDPLVIDAFFRIHDDLRQICPKKKPAARPKPAAKSRRGK